MTELKHERVGGYGQWWASFFGAAVLTTGASLGHIVVAQDDFGNEPRSALEAVETPFSFPDEDPLVLEDPPSPPLPEGDAPGSDDLLDVFSPPNNGPGDAANDIGKNTDTSESSKPAPATNDGPAPVGPRASGRNGVADFTKKSPGAPIVRRELTRNEQRIVNDTLRRSERLMVVSEGAFREGQTSLTRYAQSLDVASKMNSVTAEILVRPELERAALESQGALLREASQQLNDLNQPNGGRWNSERMLADVLIADTMFKLASLQKEQNNEQIESSAAARMEAAQRLFEQRLGDYRIGWAELGEVTQAARFLIPPATKDMNSEQQAALAEAISEYQQVLLQAESRVELWNRSKANMGTDQLMSIIRNDGGLTPLSPLGPDGTGLASDDAFPGLHAYDELILRSATRPSPLEHGEIFPSEFDQTGVDGGAGRTDHVQQTQAEVLFVTAQIAELNGDKSAAQDAYTRSFEVADKAFQTELELYQNGNASLGDVTQAWMAGQAARQSWEQSQKDVPQDWSEQQRADLDRLQDLTARGHDRRGAGMEELEMIGSLQSFEAVRDLKRTLDREMAAQQTAQDATSAVSGKPFERVQTFLPAADNAAPEALNSDGVDPEKSPSPPPGE
ncbi:MAG: hypothetical protein ACKVT0_15280 [Planctomycetaceae bacterium]